MKSNLKKVLVLTLMGILVSCNSGSGSVSSGIGGGGQNNVTKKNIVIYAGGSSEFTWVKGSEEDDVIEYITDKYYNDTGIALDFKVNYLGQDMKNKLASAVAGKDQVDIVISHTRGGDGIDDYFLRQKWFYDLSYQIDAYGPHLKKAIEGTPMDSLTTVEDQVIGIPSVINPYKFGILVRKDLMEKLGYTEDKTKEGTLCTTAGKNYELVDNLDTFEKMCVEMKPLLQGTRPIDEVYTISGAPWDWEKAITLGAYSNAGFFTTGKFNLNGTEKVLPGSFSEQYGDVLDREYKWASELKIVSAETSLVEQAESEFISGKTGVFVCDPTIEHLIKVSRMTKEYLNKAEFTVLGALKAHKDSPDTAKGFMRNTPATFAACVYKDSKNVKDIIGFLNWMFTPDANDSNYFPNYELCRYGIPGTHWVRNADGTYSYPEGKEEYLIQPPYSGIVALVENQRASNLTYKQYSAEELSWIQTARDSSNYIENDVIDYLFELSESHRNFLSTSNSKIWGIVNEAWAGKTNPNPSFKNTSASIRGQIGGIIEAYTQQYNSMKQKREGSKG